MILFDTYAWVEYLRGSDKGKISESYLKKDEVATPSIVLIELSCKAVKEKWNFKKCLRFIKSKSLIVGMSEETIIGCGEVYYTERKRKPGFGIVDAVILTTAKKLGARILTGDEHFRDLKETIMIK